jgi:hypothetical protein
VSRLAIEEEFQRSCELAVEECRRVGYIPTAWIGMMHGPSGAVAAARRLLTSGDVQSGFERLIRMGRADLTVEQAVLDDRWGEFFTDAHREAAQWRLTQARSSAESR